MGFFKSEYLNYLDDSHALTAAPPDWEAPEGPSAQTKAKIFGIFPFLAAYITDSYSLQARRASALSGPFGVPNAFERFGSVLGTAAQTERKFGSVFGKKVARTEPNRTVATLARIPV